MNYKYLIYLFYFILREYKNMPTICEIKIELKNKGIKGVTGLNKAQLQSLLDGKKPEPKTNKSFKPVVTPAKTAGNKQPKRITMKEEAIPDNLKDKSYIFLKKKVDKIENIINNSASTPAERKQATNKLSSYKKAMSLAKTKQYSKKKK